MLQPLAPFCKVLTVEPFLLRRPFRLEDVHDVRDRDHLLDGLPQQLLRQPGRLQAGHQQRGQLRGLRHLQVKPQPF